MEMDEVKQTDETDNGNERIRAVYDWVSAAVFSLVCVTIVFACFFRIVGVDGASMMDTLYHQDRLILTRWAYTPQRGDIVVINRYTEEPLVKRIIAVGGDTIYIDPETYAVYLNGEKLEEPYVHYNTLPYDMIEALTIPEGCVFVMGDHRDNSKDSRSAEIGFVDERDIMGKAIFRLWPLQRFGGLYD